MRLWSKGTPEGLREVVFGKLTRKPVSEEARRRDFVAYGESADLAAFCGDWAGYAGVLCTSPVGSLSPAPPLAIYKPANLDYLTDYDVVALSPDGTVRVW